MDASPITVESLRFFGSAAGREMLAVAAGLDGLRPGSVEALRRRFPAGHCAAAFAVAATRRAARDKFADADRLFFDRMGLEMASREDVARHRAGRLPAGATVIDMCCGAGGDLLALAARGHVLAVDRDPCRLRMARMNCAAMDLDNVSFALADVCHLRPRAAAVFIDPARRRSAGDRVRRGADYAPPLAFVAELAVAVRDLAVKLSPALDEAELPADGELEFVSAGGQCREAALYCGGLASARRRATLVPEGHTITDDGGPSVAVAEPGAYVYDPDPAVVRAHLVEPLARRLDAWKLDPQVAYLSAAEHCTTPLARAYRVMACLPFNIRRLRRYLGAEGMRPVEVKKRRFPMTPEEIRRHLRCAGGGTPVTLIATRIRERPVCLVCESVGR